MSQSTPVKASSSTTPKKTSSATTTTTEKDPVKQIEKLEIKTKAVNTNNVARVANSQLTSADDKLHPLVSLKTGKAIDKFPDTTKALQKLSLTVVDAMLNTLEADRTGNEEQKREKLRVEIGLKPNPA